MTRNEQVIQAGKALYGENYKSALAADLKVHRDTVQDWAANRMTPRPGVMADIKALLEQRANKIAEILKMLD